MLQNPALLDCISLIKHVSWKSFSCCHRTGLSPMQLSWPQAVLWSDWRTSVWWHCWHVLAMCSGSYRREVRIVVHMPWLAFVAATQFGQVPATSDEVASRQSHIQSPCLQGPIIHDTDVLCRSDSPPPVLPAPVSGWRACPIWHSVGQLTAGIHWWILWPA